MVCGIGGPIMKALQKSVSGKNLQTDYNTNHKQFEENHAFILIKTYDGDFTS